MPSSVRTQLQTLLTTYLPQDGSVVLIPYSRDVEGPARSTVMPRLDSVEPGQVQGTRVYLFTLILIAAATAAGAGDDELEALLEDVLFAVQKTGMAITWDKATRTTFEGRAPAFALPLRITVNIE